MHPPLDWHVRRPDAGTRTFLLRGNHAVQEADAVPAGTPRAGTTEVLDLTVVVPTFNEGANVATLVERLTAAFAGHSAEILFVDDSTDDTPDEIARVSADAALPVRLLHREGDERTGGLAGAVTAGILASTSEYVLVMDGDLQHPPEMAPLLRAAAEGVDLSVASRYTGDGDASGLSNAWRRLVSSGSTVLTQACFPRRVGRVCTDPMTGFFCVRRSALDTTRLRPRGFKILLEILARHDLRVREIPFEFGERLAGDSKASWRNGLQFLHQMAGLRLGRMSRFAAVGALGTVVNLAVMALLVHGAPGIGYITAAVVAAEASILHNFLLQERFVFRDVREGAGGWGTRLTQHLLFNNAEALVRLPVLVLLVERLGLGAVLAQALTLSVAFVLRFLFVSRVVYRARPAVRLAAPPQPTTPAGTGTPGGLTLVTPTMADAPSQVLPGDTGLPTPPDDVERDLYLSSQHRWLAPATFVGYMLIVVGVGYFVQAHPWSALLLVPLLLSTLSTVISLCTSVQRSRVTLAGHRARVRAWQPGRRPSVDVFLPSAGEPLEVLDNTFAWVRRVVWDGPLTVYVLDDSGRPEVARMARERGFRYLSRPDRGHLKKAGNLRYGHARSDGEFIVILDADFVPRSDFLDELIPYFDDPGVGIVQSPQFFDIRVGMNWVQRAAGATQVLFYRYIQSARDVNDAAICVGTSAVYRRSALDAGGGFAAIDHSEDMYTGINLAGAGFSLRYVATVVTKGVCPDSFEGFVTQQYRWCAGSMSLMLSRDFHRLPMSVPQRLSFWAGFLYYVSTAVDVVTAAVPSLLMVYFAANQVAVENYVFVLLALVARQALIPFITGNSDSLVNLTRIQTTYSFAHLVQIVDQLRGREDGGWVATGAASSSSRARRIIRTARVFLVTSQLLMWAALAWRVPEHGLDDYWPMVAFALFNLYVTWPIILADAHLPRPMQAARELAETGRTRPEAVAA